MYVNDWRNLIRIIYTPPLFFLLYIYLLRESPRWQILNGKIDDAKKNLKEIAKLNKINIPDKDIDCLDEVELKKKFNIGAGQAKGESVLEVFKSLELMKRVLVGFSSRFTASFVYYGLMVNSVWLPGNKYTNFMLATLMSYPGELAAMYLMNKYGRKKPLMVGYFLSGVLCVASAYAPQDKPWVIILLFLFGKMIIAACFTGAVTYVMELFPTSIRGSTLGLCALASRVGSMLAPLTPMLLFISPILPSLCFGASAVISAMLLTLTAETKGAPLMDTIDQLKQDTKELNKSYNTYL